MTLARKIYLMMEIGKKYFINEIVDMLYSAEREYMETNPDFNELLEQQWIEAIQGANVNQKIRDALKITRKYGYTTVNVNVIPAHDVVITTRRKKCGVSIREHKTIHRDEFTEFTYIRIK